ncbi:unnamed protein product [Mytilus coruscus]|uniref:Uncharacterized protein n=1 Tax=Mytilus coruscus TaxID=42192 RepID=A0A6J8AY30_MYTCO|nr:unnamed protein product [Mytilus coruscus]
MKQLILHLSKGKLKLQEKEKDKPWYNTLLHDLKKSLDHYSRVLSLNPFNKELRAKCFHLSKTYNKTRKEKRRNYFKDLMVKLKNTSQSNPKAFWDIINTLKSSDQENKESSIDAESCLNGSFKRALNDLNSRGQKAFFKLTNIFKNTPCDIQNFTFIFDHTVKPVVLYASEILGIFDTRKCNKYNSENIFDQNFNTVPTEKINLNMCRYLLKVNRKTCKLALYGELDRFPLYIDIIMSMIKYWIRLYNDKPKDALLSGALAENITMIDNNQQCWLSCIKCILNECGLSHFYKNPKSIKNNFLLVLRKCLQCKFEKQWSLQLQTSDKLRTYRLFKNILNLKIFIRCN